MAELQIFPVLSYDAVSTEAPSAENTAEVMTTYHDQQDSRHKKLPLQSLRPHQLRPHDSRKL